MAAQGEQTLADLFAEIWGARLSIFLFALAGILIAFLVIVFSTPLYRGSLIVAPADGYALGDYASSLSEGDGMNLPFWRPKDQEGVSTDFYRFVYTIQGPQVAAILLKDQSVLKGIAQDGAKPAGTNWTAEELGDYLSKKIKVEHLGTTPLRKISYRHPDPVFAAVFLRKIHLVADQLIRRDRRRGAESRIKYLESTLQKTANPDHRRGIADLLMQQEHIQMLANLDEPYAAIVVEPPSSSSKPVWPDKALLLAVFALIGGAAGYAVRTARHEE
ncbi:MAG: hypothetical protein DI551_12035 [Micavibrio aeruginosavorus]|uniref:Polysaccharide chain length determinant N-terminal domain-containing protein n=1 Tax=Micavibrio aeruginosavorus TaxID=349221 RepID=A0A2W5MQH9_9BACT|nr:MAG: hypothetical protein DI551_12035 [Micavibrio aeruginosavorus]